MEKDFTITYPLKKPPKKKFTAINEYTIKWHDTHANKEQTLALMENVAATFERLHPCKVNYEKEKTVWKIKCKEPNCRIEFQYAQPRTGKRSSGPYIVADLDIYIIDSKQNKIDKNQFDLKKVDSINYSGAAQFGKDQLVPIKNSGTIFVFDHEVDNNVVKGYLDQQDLPCININFNSMKGWNHLKNLILVACFRENIENIFNRINEQVRQPKYQSAGIGFFGRKTPTHITDLTTYTTPAKNTMSYINPYGSWDLLKLFRKLKACHETLANAITHNSISRTEFIQIFYIDQQRNVEAFIKNTFGTNAIDEILYIIIKASRQQSTHKKNFNLLPEELIHYILSFLAPAQDIENAFKHANRLAMKK